MTISQQEQTLHYCLDCYWVKSRPGVDCLNPAHPEHSHCTALAYCADWNKQGACPGFKKRLSLLDKIKTFFF